MIQKPGIYTKEIDFAKIWTAPKRLIRIRKLGRLFGFKCKYPVIITQSPKGMINKPLLINNYDDFENVFGSTNESKKNI